MFEVGIRTHFSAAHHLVGYPGHCADPHGHNWEVEVFIRGRKLNATGILVDFRQIKELVREALGRLDHTDLNRLKMFQNRNPTSENIARFLYKELAKGLGGRGRKVSRVTVRETPESTATYWEE